MEQFRTLYQADPTSPLAQTLYSSALASNGQRDEAIAVIDRMKPGAERNVETGFRLLLKYEPLKDKENELRVMTPEFQKTCKRDWEWSYNVAGSLSLAGARQEALDWLGNDVHRGFINYLLIQSDPFFDNIRGDGQFKKLAEQVKYRWEHFEVLE